MPEIKLEEQVAKSIARGDHPDYEIVEESCDLNSAYKDYATAETIVKEISTGKYFCLSWNKYISHYGSGEHDFYDSSLVEVVPEEIEIPARIEKIWKVVE